MIQVRISSELSALDDSEIKNKKTSTQEGFVLQLQDVEYEYEKEDSKGFKVGTVNCSFKAQEMIFTTGGKGRGKSTLAKVLKNI